jgi:hypothetical protein
MGSRTAAMEKVKNRDTQFELVVFSQQVLDKAIASQEPWLPTKKLDMQKEQRKLHSLCYVST